MEKKENVTCGEEARGNVLLLLRARRKEEPTISAAGL